MADSPLASGSSAPRPVTGVERSGTLLELSNAMVRLYKEQFGRGPTKARSSFAGPNMICVVLEDTMTPAERSLVDMGEHQRLRDTRLFFQHASEDRFRSTVEEVTGRKVRAFISGIDTVADVSVETFVLEPAAPDGGRSADGSVPAIH